MQLFKERNLILLFVVYIMLVFNLLHPVTPEMLGDKQTPAYIFGFLFGMMSLGMFLGSPYWGKRIDREGIKKVFIISISIYTIFQFCFGVTTNSSLMLLFRFLAGLGSGGIIIAYTTYLTILTPIEERGKILGFLAVATSIGTIFGQIIGGYLGVYGYQFVVMIQTLGLISVLVIIIFFIRNLQTDSQNQPKSTSNPIKILLSYRKRAVFPIILLELLFVTSIVIFFTALPIFATNVLGFSSIEIGMLNAIYGFGAMFGGLTVGFLIRQYGLKKLYLLAILFSTIAMILIMPSKILWLALLLFALLGYFSSLHKPVAQNIGLNLEEKHKGEIVGVFHAISSLGMFLGAFLSGILYYTNEGLPFIVAISISIISFIYMLYYYRQKPMNNF